MCYSFTSDDGWPRESEGGSHMLWMLWTFVLGALPGFFSTDWLGPVVPGPSNVTSTLIVLAVLLLIVAIRGKGSSIVLQKKTGGLLTVLGIAATLVWMALIAVSYIYNHPLEYQLSESMRMTCFNLMGLLRVPSESLALTGWSLLTLRRFGVRRGGLALRTLGLFLGGALWPCALLLLGIACSGSSLPAIHGLDLWSMAACLASGTLFSAICVRMRKSGVHLMDLVALLAGFDCFRAAADVVNTLLVTFSNDMPIVGLLATIVYLILAGAGGIFLWCVIGSRKRDSEDKMDKGADQQGFSFEVNSLPGAARLTDRERTVIQKTINGFTTQQIAERHGLSASTVGTYRRRAYEKLGIAKKKELTNLLSRESSHGVGTIDKETTVAVNYAHATTLSRRARVTTGFIITILLALIPASYISFDFPPYGVQTGEIAPYLVGVVILLSGIAGWARVCPENGPALDISNGMLGDRDALLRTTAVALGALAAGWVVSMAWLWPFPGFEVPTLFFDWLIWRAWALLGMGSVVLAHGAFFGDGSGGPKSKTTAPVLFRKGIDELLLRRPYHLALIGVGFQLFTIEDNVYSLDILTMERFTELCWLVPRVLVIVLLVLVGIRAFHYNDQGEVPSGHDGLESTLLAKGLSELQVKVVLMTLDGKTSEEIASVLYLAPGTVRAYRSRACKILGVSDLSKLERLSS